MGNRLPIYQIIGIGMLFPCLGFGLFLRGGSVFSESLDPINPLFHSIPNQDAWAGNQSSGPDLTLGPKGSGPGESASGESASGESEKDPSFREYLRLRERGLDTRIWVLHSPEKPSLILLIGMVHIGEASYYREIQSYLQTCDLVFYEGVQTEISDHISLPGKFPYFWAGLEFQDLLKSQDEVLSTSAESLGLRLQQEFFWPEPNWIRADVNVREFSEMIWEIKSMEIRIDKNQAESEDIETQAMDPSSKPSPHDRIGLRRYYAKKIFDETTDLLNRSEYKPLYEVLVQKRNDKAIQIMEGSLDKPGVYALVYGAGHMPDFLYQFKKKWNYQVHSVRWVPAWSIE
jgi:hypothetical protein